MPEQLRFFLNRLRERLWIKPLIFCALSVAAALLARGVDGLVVGAELDRLIPDITRDSIEELLKISAASMLVIATFSVASMVSAYASAGNTATPRAFALIVADDVSQMALSTFVGVFIFSIVALVALMNGYYGKQGRFVLFSLTLLVLAIVIVTFVRWVDQIARLGRIGNIVEKVEGATAAAMQSRRDCPTLGAMPVAAMPTGGRIIFAQAVGYVQRVDVSKLQKYAEEQQLHIEVCALPGTFAMPGRPIARACSDHADLSALDNKRIGKAFVIGRERLFENDPRFGLVVLSEVASRALSPAVNDPGTAIVVIGALVRLFLCWSQPREQAEPARAADRVHVPELSLGDMFDDAFMAIARDGAAMTEVQLRLQKALQSLAQAGDPIMKDEAARHARSALARAEQAMRLPSDVELIRHAAIF